MSTAKVAAMKDPVRVHLKINGRVQGVYFRASTVEQARRLGVTGWVMNCADSSVEVIAEGAREQLKKLISWCGSGPPGAQVEKICTEWEDSRNEFQGFFIKR
jgi:acylphosphatase